MRATGALLFPSATSDAKNAPEGPPSAKTSPVKELVSLTPEYVNVAVAARSLPIATAQLPVPAQSPLQPVNVQPAEAVALSVTVVELVSVAPQTGGQPISFAALDTVPWPETETVSVCVVSANVALTDRSLLIDSVQAPVPVQSPLQPANAQPDVGAALSVTLVELVNALLQVDGQIGRASWRE